MKSLLYLIPNSSMRKNSTKTHSLISQMKSNSKLKASLLWIGIVIIIVLSSCQAETFQPSVIPTIAQAPTNTPTIEPLLTVIPSPNPTIAKVNTPIAIATITLLPPAVTANIPTRSPWLILPGTEGFFFQTYDQIFFFDGISSHFVAPGNIFSVEGQPWSPNGTQFVFDASEGPSDLVSNPPLLTIANLQTGEVMRLDLDRPAYDGFWSPNGKSFLYSITDSTTNLIKLVLYDLQTTQSHLLTEIFRDPGATFSMTGWSSDSQKLAFVTGLNGQYDLFVFDIPSLTLRQLTNTSELETFSAWSPISNQLLVGTNPYEL